VERITRDRFRNRVNTIEEVSAADSYTVEARFWVEQAEAARKLANGHLAKQHRHPRGWRWSLPELADLIATS